MATATPIRGGYNRPAEIAVTEDQLKKFKAAARAMWREKDLEPIMVFLAEYFNVPVPNAEVGEQYSNCYDPTTKTIYIDKHSVVSLLHEYWHHARHVLGLENTEEGARTFSVTLYAVTFPNLYRQMVEAGRLYWY